MAHCAGLAVQCCMIRSDLPSVALLLMGGCDGESRRRLHRLLLAPLQMRDMKSHRTVSDITFNIVRDLPHAELVVSGTFIRLSISAPPLILSSRHRMHPTYLHSSIHSFLCRLAQLSGSQCKLRKLLYWNQLLHRHNCWPLLLFCALLTSSSVASDERQPCLGRYVHMFSPTPGHAFLLGFGAYINRQGQYAGALQFKKIPDGLQLPTDPEAYQQMIRDALPSVPQV